MAEWFYCHKCYVSAGAKIALPEPGQEVILSYMDRDGNRDVGMGVYIEEGFLVTKRDSDIMPEEGMRFKSRGFTIFGEDETAVVPYDEQHVYYERRGRRNFCTYIGYAWRPVDYPAETDLNEFPEYC